MHRALEIEDILVPICRRVTKDKDLLSLACTSKWIYSVAISELWRSCGHAALRHLETLLTDNTYRLSTLDMKIERLLMHARYIQHLDLQDERVDFYVEVLVPKEWPISLANSVYMEPLLPSVRSLDLRTDLLYTLDWIVRLFSRPLPSLVSLSLRLADQRPEPSFRWNDRLFIILCCIPCKVLNLRQLDIEECLFDAPDSADSGLGFLRNQLDKAYTRVVNSLQHLESFSNRRNGINSDTIVALGRKRRLESLHLVDMRIPLENIDMQRHRSVLFSLQGDQLFESLESLFLNMDHSFWTPLLALVSSPRLRSIIVMCEATRQDGDALLPAFARNVSTFASLETLQATWVYPIEGTDDVESEQNVPAGRPLGTNDSDYEQENAHALHWAIFTPILACKNLRRLTLDLRMFRPLTITDADIADIASSCPLLERLVLHSWAGKVVRGCSPTLASFVTLATHCPHLYYLQLGQVDGRNDCPLSLEGIWRDRPTLRLETNRCPIYDPYEVAGLLLSLWPYATVTTGNFCSPGTRADWAVVQDLLDQDKSRREAQAAARASSYFH